MLVSVLYYNDNLKGYSGRKYTYRTELPLAVFQKVIVPVADGSKKKALVTDVDLPESTVDPAWADKLKNITELDKGDEE